MLARIPSKTLLFFKIERKQHFFCGVSEIYFTMATTTSTMVADSTRQEFLNSELSSPAGKKILALSRSRDLLRSNILRKVWSHSTQGKNLTLYRFRRLKSSHLVNLCFLEEKISELDHRVFQAGLKLDNGT